MKIANYFIRCEREEKELKEKERKEFSFARQTLKVFDLYSLSHTQKLIDDITYKIEMESGWKYAHYGFELPSEFHMENGEIHYKVNRVGDGYSYQDSMNSQEMLFLEKYSSLLKRLSKLEEKKKNYLLKGAAPKNVVSFERKSRREKNQEELSMLGLIEMQADEFVAHYPRGVNDLVSLLNVISGSSDVKDAYSQIKKIGGIYSYQKELLKWASIFSKRGNILYERVLDEHEKLVQRESLPLGSFMKDESDMILYYKNRKN